MAMACGLENEVSLGAVVVSTHDSLGELLRAQRHRAHLSQEELAERSGLSERTIRNLEADRVRVPRASTARLLGEALGLTGPAREAFLQACRGTPESVVRSEMLPPALRSGPTRPQRDVPAQLPLDGRGFAGRDDHLACLDASLTTVGEPSSPPVLLAVSGTAGVGKTALAVHWAHRVAGRFDDGQLYQNLRGFDPNGAKVRPAKALDGFLQALGVPARHVPADLDNRASLYRSVLAGRRMLVLLDNAGDAEHVRPLLPATPGCLVLVTSRDKLTGLVAREGAYPLTLDLLSDQEARDMVERRLGAERVAAEPEAVGEIIDRCCGLPIALANVIAEAALHPKLSLDVLAQQSRCTRDSLDALAADNLDGDECAVTSSSHQPSRSEPSGSFQLLRAASWNRLLCRCRRRPGRFKHVPMTPRSRRSIVRW